MKLDYNHVTIVQPVHILPPLVNQGVHSVKLDNSIHKRNNHHVRIVNRVHLVHKIHQLNVTHAKVGFINQVMASQVVYHVIMEVLIQIQDDHHVHFVLLVNLVIQLNHCNVMIAP